MSAVMELWRQLSPEQVAAATLLCLYDMGPKRLGFVLDRWPDPVAALAAVRAGKGDRAIPEGSRPVRPEDRRILADRWAQSAATLALGPELDRRATKVFLAGAAGYPITDELPDLPRVLLGEGAAPEVFHRPRVAIVGTRSATAHGLDDARALGGFLAGCGVTVVSGLAIGIDAAAHGGALDAGGGVVGVVATGLDIVYPRRHTVLFERVRSTGMLVSESGFGVPAEAWRFPVRNRIIAALADVVIVVEATKRGGARITAERALEYGRPVLAMPGSRRNLAAAGCNALLADGAQPLLDPDDVLLALGLTPGSRRGWGSPASKPVPTGDAARVLRACGGEPASVDQLASRTGLPLDTVMRELRELHRDGWVDPQRGWWWPQ